MSGEELIVFLTSSAPSERFMSLVESLRSEVEKIGANMESNFRLHITLGRIKARLASLEQVEEVVKKIDVPPFTLTLQDAEYKFTKSFRRMVLITSSLVFTIINTHKKTKVMPQTIRSGEHRSHVTLYARLFCGSFPFQFLCTFLRFFLSRVYHYLFYLIINLNLKISVFAKIFSVDF